jgi:hypothetical protein
MLVDDDEAVIVEPDAGRLGPAKRASPSMRSSPSCASRLAWFSRAPATMNRLRSRTAARSTDTAPVRTPNSAPRRAW